MTSEQIDYLFAFYKAHINAGQQSPEVGHLVVTSDLEEALYREGYDSSLQARLTRELYFLI